MSTSPTKTPTTSGGAATTPTASTPSSSKTTPKDAQVITTILRDMGVNEYEPRVVHQLLEFSYRYVSQVLEDAVVYSTYANKKSVDVEDVRLAVEKLSDKMFTSPPPRDLLMEIARQKNQIPLPVIKSHAGPRLPNERYSLMSANYKSKSPPRPNGITIPSGQAVYRSASGSIIRPSIVSLQPRNQASSSSSPITKVVMGSIDPSQGVKRKLDS